MSKVEGSGYYKETVNLRAENADLRARLERAEAARDEADAKLCEWVDHGDTLFHALRACLELVRAALGAAGARGEHPLAGSLGAFADDPGWDLMIDVIHRKRQEDDASARESEDG